MLAILPLLVMFVANIFKSRCRLEAENPVSTSSAQHLFEAGATSSAAVRQRPGVVSMDDASVAQPARYIAGRETGDHLAMASFGFLRLLALEIQK